MTTSKLQPHPPLAADDAALARLVKQAGVAKDGLIRVTGPAGLTAVLGLCRHGYERAVYVHANWVATTRLADALLLPHPCSAQELQSLVRRGDGVRDGGVLIAEIATASDAGDSLTALLEPFGYRVEHRMSEKGRSVCIARRAGVGDFRKAA